MKELFRDSLRLFFKQLINEWAEGRYFPDALLEFATDTFPSTLGNAQYIAPVMPES